MTGYRIWHTARIWASLWPAQAVVEWLGLCVFEYSVEVCMEIGKTGSHGAHGIPMGMGIRSAMGWEWELSAWEWELRRGVGIVFCSYVVT